MRRQASLAASTEKCLDCCGVAKGLPELLLHDSNTLVELKLLLVLLAALSRR